MDAPSAGRGRGRRNAAPAPSRDGVGCNEGDNGSYESAAMHRLDAEYSAEQEQGGAGYVLRTIPKGKLQAFKALHPEIRWDNPDKEELAMEVFGVVPDKYFRVDAVLDLRTDSVSEFEKKTRARLVSYGNQLALRNLKNGFPPRPIYLIAIDAAQWRRCVLDPMGLITVEDKTAVDFDSFNTQQKLRSSWLQKKDPRGLGYFSTVQAWTCQTLQAQLEECNRLLMRTEDTSGVAPGIHIVSSLWEFGGYELWNGRGLEGQFLQGTLSLCEGLLRLTCGDKVCEEGWSPQKLRILFGRQHEENINRCLAFERGVAGTVMKPLRPLACTYSADVVCAAISSLGTSKPSPEFEKGFNEFIVKAKLLLKGVVRRIGTSKELLQVGSAYGGDVFLDYLQTMATMDILGCDIVVHDDIADSDSVRSFKAMAISVDKSQIPKLRVLKNCKVLVCDPGELHPCLLHDLLKSDLSCLVIFARHIDWTSLRLLDMVKGEVFVVTVEDGNSFCDLATYLGIQVLDRSKEDLVGAIGDAEKIFTCRHKLIVYQSISSASVALEQVLELQVSGANPRQFMDRTAYVLKAVEAMNSARLSGLIPGEGIGFFEVGEKLARDVETLLSSDDNEYTAGAEIVSRSLQVGAVLSPYFGDHLAAKHCHQDVYKLARGFGRYVDMLEGGVVDLYEAAEETLDHLSNLYKFCTQNLHPVKKPRLII